MTADQPERIVYCDECQATGDPDLCSACHMLMTVMESRPRQVAPKRIDSLVKPDDVAEKEEPALVEKPKTLIEHGLRYFQRNGKKKHIGIQSVADGMGITYGSAKNIIRALRAAGMITQRNENHGGHIRAVIWLTPQGMKQTEVPVGGWQKNRRPKGKGTHELL